MGDFGIKISEEGNNVFTSNLDNTSFTSENSSLMLIETQSLQLIAAEGTGGATQGLVEDTYSHNLGYPPLVLAYGQSDGGGYFNPLPYFQTIAPFEGAIVYSWVVMDINSERIRVRIVYLSFDPDTFDGVELAGDVTFDITLSIYGYKLGSTT